MSDKPINLVYPEEDKNKLSIIISSTLREKIDMINNKKRYNEEIEIIITDKIDNSRPIYYSIECCYVNKCYWFL